MTVPPNAPGAVVYSDQRDFATRFWPVNQELAPGMVYTHELDSEARVGGVVHRGSTLVFNVPPDGSVDQVQGIVMLIGGQIVAMEPISGWPTKLDDPNAI